MWHWVNGERRTLCTKYDPKDDAQKYHNLAAELAQTKGVAKREKTESELQTLKSRMRRFGYDTAGRSLTVSA